MSGAGTEKALQRVGSVAVGYALIAALGAQLAGHVPLRNGILLGSVLAGGSFWISMRILARVLHRDFAVRIFFASNAVKMLALAVILGAAVQHPAVHALGLLLGLSSIVVGAFAEAARILIGGMQWQESNIPQR
ncbi:MAG: hypothetical protein HYV63_02595 [Candidatus Schekmanbacteria bacterium]|nr:hypothetical protein [Candidatus Schekmanbacteria bacterium]